MSGHRPVRAYTWRQPVPKPMPPPSAMQRRMAAEIAEHGISLSELARLTKMQIAHLRKLLAGQVRHPAADTLARLDVAVEAVKVARGLAPAPTCDRCERRIDDDMTPRRKPDIESDHPGQSPARC